jgi:trk system potassium uptake protein TrkA
MDVVAVGAGDVGTPLVELATADGDDVVGIERGPDRAATQYDRLVVVDDATPKQTLLDARSAPAATAPTDPRVETSRSADVRRTPVES